MERGGEAAGQPMEGDEDRESPQHSGSESDDDSEIEELIALNMLRRRYDVYIWLNTYMYYAYIHAYYIT